MTQTVLVVEDSLSTLKALKTMLRLHDYDVVGEAYDGVEAIRLYQELHPDLVLMDIAMPKMHGIDAIREIMQLDSNARIIAITALYSPDKRRQAVDAGAIALITKPFTVGDLIGSISTVLAS